MGNISILDPLTANQIAAGEVVERPVSVIKELVENSVDAGSTRIKINLWEGGTKRIQVLDNGWGIPAEQLALSVERHATSKIKTVEDLNSLTTLGFRGEALPSIAAVSKMIVSSRTADSSAGFALQVTGGNKGDLVEIGCPVGTEITVDDLFFNTPARKKFLKSPSTELGAISDLVGRIAMSQPDIAFELMHEKKILLRTPGNGNLAQVIFSVYGNEIARNMKQVQHDLYPFIRGFVSIPQLTRSSRHHYNFFLNGRVVKSQELSEALEEAYYTRIPAKRYPIGIIHLELSPDLFDVNVHPAKLEVKFRDIYPIKEALIKAVEKTLEHPITSIPQMQKRTTNQEPEAVQQEVFRPETFDRKVIPIKVPPMNEAATGYALPKADEDRQMVNPVRPSSEPSEDEEESQPFFSLLKVLGQIAGTYIIASGSEGLYIIDQHAAHERIRYEKIEKCFREQPSASNLLSVPITIELTAQQTLWLVDHILTLADLGFILEHFGDNTFLLRGVPRWHLEGDSQELLLDILEKLGSGSRDSMKEIISEEKLFSLACKSAVKGNSFLTDTDIHFLLHQLDLAKNPFTCPHGRPVIIALTHEEIKRKFLRT